MIRRVRRLRLLAVLACLLAGLATARGAPLRRHEPLLGAAPDPGRRRARPDGPERRLVPPERPAHAGQSSPTSSPASPRSRRERRRRPRGAGDDGPARRAARPRARPRRRGSDLLRGRGCGGLAAAGAVRHRGRRPPARPAHEPPGGPGRLSSGSRSDPAPARGGRLLRRRRSCSMSELGDAGVEDAAADLRAPRAHALAAPRAHDRGRLHRLPVRLGRRERAAANRRSALQAAAAASTAPASPGASTSSSRIPGAPQLAAILRGRTAAAMAGEVPRRLRIKPAGSPRPTSLFFGTGGPRAQARADRPHGHLPRQRLADPLLGLRRRARAGRRLVRATGSPGAAGRSPKPAS